MELLYILVGVILIIIAMIIGAYNKLIALKEAVFTDEKQISIQLDERSKVFDSLINTVKKYMSHEEGVLAKVVELREKAKGVILGSDQSKEIENELSEIVASGKLSSGINITMEAYPDLKASSNLLQLQETIVSIEAKLAGAKKAFNMSIEDYNTYAESAFGAIVCSMFKHLKYKFERWSLSAESIVEAEKKVVDFD